MHVRSLRQWCGVRITDKGGLQVEIAIFVESPGKARDVFASITLASHEEGLVLEGELRPDVGDKVDELIGSLVHCSQKWATI